MTDSTQASGFIIPLHYGQYISASAPTGGNLRFEAREQPGPSFLELLAEVCPCGSKKKRLSRGQQAERAWLAERRRQSVAEQQSPFSDFQRRMSIGTSPARPSPAHVPTLSDIVERTEPNTTVNSPDVTPLAVDAARSAWLPGPVEPARVKAARERSRRNSRHIPLLGEEAGPSRASASVHRLSAVEEEVNSSTASQVSDHVSLTTHEGGFLAPRPPPKPLKKERRKASRSSRSHRSTKKGMKAYMEQGREASHEPRKQTIAMIEGIWSRFRPLFKKKSQSKLNGGTMEMTSIVSRPQSPNTVEVTQMGIQDVETMSGALSISSGVDVRDFGTNDETSRADSNDGPGKIQLSRSNVALSSSGQDNSVDEGSSQNGGLSQNQTQAISH